MCFPRFCRPEWLRSPATGKGYAFENAWVEARRRLNLLEELYDPVSIRSLERVGVKPG